MSVRSAFDQQGRACAALGSPFMGRLMPLIGARLSEGAVAERVLGWQGDPSSAANSVPLRLAGALHALKLDGLALADVYPPNEVSDDRLWQAVNSALIRYEARILEWLDNPPQTNEVRRAAPLVAVLSMVAARYGKPIELLELGCSGGLNLRADQFHVVAGGTGFGPSSSPVQVVPDWQGSVPSAHPMDIVARHGVDLSPVDPTSSNGRLRLLAYLWPDQPERIARTEAAIELARKTPAEITAEDAGDWTERMLARADEGSLRFLYHTVAWQYFPYETKAQALAAMEASPGPMVRFGMENDGGRGARLTLTHYPAGEEQELGRADFHGRWVEWTP